MTSGTDQNDLFKEHFAKFLELSKDLHAIAQGGFFLRLKGCWETTLGWTKEELCSRPAISFVHPDDFAATLAVQTQLLDSSGGEGQFENRFQHKDGHWIDLSWSISRWKEGGLTFATARDMTIKRKVQQELAQSNLQFHQILDAIADFVLVKGPKSHLVWGNKAFREYYGMSNAELQGIIDAPTSEPDHTQQYINDDAMVFATGQILDIPCEPVTRYDGVVRLFHTVKYPIFDANGKIILTVGISHDITDGQKAKEELERHQAMAMASAKLASLGEMAGSIAHEINNPLAIIDGRAQNLKVHLERCPPNLSDALLSAESIMAMVTRIAGIVQGLQALSRNADKDPLVNESAKDIIEDSLALCRERFKKSAITLRSSISTDNLTIICRRTQISQILINLLNNAHDAVVDRPDKWIEVSATDCHDAVEFAVVDSGLGIPPQLREKIMQPFFSTKPVGKGTGLGLSISKRVVEDHGGTFEYLGNAKNTTFVFRIPKPQK